MKVSIPDADKARVRIKIVLIRTAVLRQSINDAVINKRSTRGINCNLPIFNRADPGWIADGVPPENTVFNNQLRRVAIEIDTAATASAGSIQRRAVVCQRAVVNPRVGLQTVNGAAIRRICAGYRVTDQ